MQTRDVEQGHQVAFIDQESLGLLAIPPSPYVLVVDDDKAILSVVELLLEMENYASVSISDSQEVLPFLQRLMREQRFALPALILLDLMMPEFSGYEIAAHLSQDEHYAHIPIIVMTADCRVRETSAVPGATDWISKPFQLEELLAKLERYLTPVIAKT